MAEQGVVHRARRRFFGRKGRKIRVRVQAGTPSGVDPTHEIVREASSLSYSARAGSSWMYPSISAGFEMAVRHELFRTDQDGVEAKAESPL
jgi:hypothetical protein